MLQVGFSRPAFVQVFIAEMHEKKQEGWHNDSNDELSGSGLIGEQMNRILVG